MGGWIGTVSENVIEVMACARERDRQNRGFIKLVDADVQISSVLKKDGSMRS